LYLLFCVSVILCLSFKGSNTDWGWVKSGELRGTLGMMREEVAGGWGKLRTEELHDDCSWDDQVKREGMGDSSTT